MLLEGKSIVVTGGNTGIGKAIVLAAAAEGANVVVDYVMHPEYTAEVIAAAGRAGGCAVGVEADVSRTDDLHLIIQTAVDEFGRLDVLVSNAGIETRTSLLETSEADFDKVLAVNLKSAFFGAQFAAQQFVAQRSGGLIVTISSTHEDSPMPGNIAYCVSKGGAEDVGMAGVAGSHRPEAPERLVASAWTARHCGGLPGTRHTATPALPNRYGRARRTDGTDRGPRGALPCEPWTPKRTSVVRARRIRIRPVPSGHSG